MNRCVLQQEFTSLFTNPTRTGQGFTYTHDIHQHFLCEHTVKIRMRPVNYWRHIIKHAPTNHNAVLELLLILFAAGDGRRTRSNGKPPERPRDGRIAK